MAVMLYRGRRWMLIWGPCWTVQSSSSHRGSAEGTLGSSSSSSPLVVGTASSFSPFRSSLTPGLCRGWLIETRTSNSLLSRFAPLHSPFFSLLFVRCGSLPSLAHPSALPSCVILMVHLAHQHPLRKLWIAHPSRDCQQIVYRRAREDCSR